MSTFREVRWERMFPDELERAFAAAPVVYFTYGMCEPHGPHSALGLDALKAQGIACRVAEAYGGIVAPSDYWHIHGLGGYAGWAARWVGEVPRDWMTAVPPWVHFKNVCYHIRTADALGFQAAILLTGHYGPNWEDLKRLVTLVQPHVGTRLFSLPDFEANVPGFDEDGQSTADHAGKVETSLLWAVEPDCVDVSRLPAPGTPSPHFAMGPDAYESSRRAGERMVADEVRWIGQKAQALLEEYRRLRPVHTLRTFDEVERLWRNVVLPELPGFSSMQLLWDEDPAPAPGSVWHENWRVTLPE